MKKLCLLFLILFIVGCASINSNLNPNPILTSKEESWYIPKGTEFQAKKKSDEELKIYISEDDLIVLFMGYYLELEKKANPTSR